MFNYVLMNSEQPLCPVYCVCAAKSLQDIDNSLSLLVGVFLNMSLY